MLWWVGLLLSAGWLWAAEFPLENGISPDQAYEVVAVDDGAGKKPVRYAVRLRRSGKRLLTIPSSYQPDTDDRSGGDFRRSAGAQAAWNPDGSLVAIDETASRYVGEVFLVRLIRGHAARVELPKETIVRAARQPWDRVSIHQPTWISARRLGLSLHGLLAATPPAGPVGKAFDVLLVVGRDGKVRLKHLQAVRAPGA